VSEDGRTANGARVSARRLMEEAEQARAHAHAPYSGFSVGAALLTRGGRIVHGCNVENASYGLSVCAERTALWKAVTEGEVEFTAIAITAGPGSGAPPCGACRQVLLEFAPELRVLWRDARGRIVARTLEELLAEPFRPEALLGPRPHPTPKRPAGGRATKPARGRAKKATRGRAAKVRGGHATKATRGRARSGVPR
jgi:cytidine deaminase